MQCPLCPYPKVVYGQSQLPVIGGHVYVVGAHVLTNQFRQVLLIELKIIVMLVLVDARLPLLSTGLDLSCINIREIASFNQTEPHPP